MLKKAAQPREEHLSDGQGESKEGIWDRFNSTDVLVIDEISMIENHMFERLSEVMSAALGNKHGGGPFGGVQIVVTGDVSYVGCFDSLKLTCVVLPTFPSETIFFLYRMRLGINKR